jgi:hypothetical protein
LECVFVFSSLLFFFGFYHFSHREHAVETFNWYLELRVELDLVLYLDLRVEFNYTGMIICIRVGR